MNNNIAFGTYNVPSTDTNLSATYVAPAVLTTEQMQQMSFSSGEKETVTGSSFDKQLTALLRVPKPKK